MSTDSHPKYPPGSAEFLLTEQFVNEDHIQAFADALNADELLLDQADASTPNLPGTPTSPQVTRIRKVSALSDFAPINLRVKRRKKGKSHEKRHDWMFLVLRWPLLFFIFIFIAGEFGLYVFIRQLVNTKEWISAWRGKKGMLRKKLRAARTYEEWKAAATTLDQYLNFQEWKEVDEDPFYDWKLVRKVKRSLRTLREQNDARGCLGVLETCIRANFAGVESPRLYSETFLGTKNLIEDYYTEQERALEYIRKTPDLTIDEKKRFFKSANAGLGISALCLSGGASFGYYHWGVVKAFLDADLLPRVITGTSAGGLIAALVCTRTDDELKKLLVPELANRITACEEPVSLWIKRLWKTGARFDSLLWAQKCMYFTRGSMTFKEAYLRTGRILNITVIPADRHSPTKILNYMTAPDTVIWTTLLASAAVPGILNPVVLMHKLRDGSIIPWNWGSRFKDGSLRSDIPTQALNLYFNVTHPVVSQVNPHVHLFFFAPRGSAGKPVAHRKGKGWRGNFLLSAGEQWLKHELTKNFKVIRDLELLPQILGQDWSSVFLQRFDGAVTIWPRTRLWDWVRILSDPDPPELERLIRVGEIVTWPKLHMIENRMKLEKQILLGRQEVRRFTKSGRGPVPAASLLQTETHSGSQGEHRRPHTSISPPPTGSDHPLSVDTDAETAFADGSSWFFRRGHASPPSQTGSGATTPRETQRDPLQSPNIRRKWASELLSPESNPEPPAPVHNHVTHHRLHQRPSTFFSRLRARSFPNLTSSPNVVEKQPAADEQSANQEDDGLYNWSTDSSSDEGLSLEDRRMARAASIIASERFTSVNDGGGGDADDL